MGKKTYLSDVDLTGNQLLRARLENLATAPLGPTAGIIYYDTVMNKARYFNGSAWLTVVDDDDPRLEDARPPSSHVLATATGLGAEQTVNGLTAGQVLKAKSATTAKFEALLHSELGADKGSNAHSVIDTHLGDATKHRLINDAATSATELLSASKIIALDGTIQGSINAHVGDASLHRIINDASSSTIELLSASKVLALIAGVNSLIGGALINKGGYNAASNTPLLDSTPIAGILNGWTYVVTAAGTFFGENIQIGDMIIANQNAPTLAAHWTTVNKNIPDIISATEIAQGLVRLATQAEVTAGADSSSVVTPATLNSRFSGYARTFNARVGTGTDSLFVITHPLNSKNVVISIRNEASGELVETQIYILSTTQIQLQFNSNPTVDQYTVSIIG